MGDKIEGDMTRQHRPCLPSTLSSLCHPMPCMHATLLLQYPHFFFIFYFFSRWRVLRIQYLCLCCRLSPHIRKHNYFPSSIVKSVLVYMAITWAQKQENIITVCVFIRSCLTWLLKYFWISTREGIQFHRAQFHHPLDFLMLLYLFS